MIKNIFLITVDCLRADYLGCINEKINLTPNIDRFSENSLLYTKAFSTGPGTRQSFPAILSSTYLHQHAGMRLLQGKITLAEVLKSNGFKTVGIHSNPFLSKPLGWGRGFDEFYDHLRDINSPSKIATKFQNYKSMKKISSIIFNLLSESQKEKIFRLFSNVYYKSTNLKIPYMEAHMINTEVINWLDRNRTEKLFIWVHYMDPHYPFIPPEKYLKCFNSRYEAFNFNLQIDYKNPIDDHIKILKKLYEGEVKYVDEYVGEFINYLNENNFLENSVVIITADHGNAFMEHGKFAHAFDILYNEVIHVPLIIHYCGYRGVNDANISLIDLPSTILDILKINKPDSFLGSSLLTSNDKLIDRIIFSESAKPNYHNLTHDVKNLLVSCIYNNWKLIKNDIYKTIELYNLKNDFYEKVNLIEYEKSVSIELLEKIRDHLSKEFILKGK